MSDKTLKSDLVHGVSALGLTIDDAALDALIALIPLLGKWNKAYNLTAITEPAAVVRKHLLDSLSVDPFLHGQTVLDVGTGAGFPGLPLALINPEKSFFLLDSHAKKLRFIDHACAELGIHNVTTVHSRVESYAPEQLFDTIVSRAFASLPQFADWIAHLLAPNGIALAMKGRADYESYNDLAAGWRAETNALVVPLLSDERHVIKLSRQI